MMKPKHPLTKALVKISQIFVVVSSILALATSQAMAFTKNDFYCAKQGGICFYDPNSCTPDSTGEEVVLTGSNNEAKTWNFFIDKGLSPEQTAGIMGNIARESGFDPENIQNPAGRTKDPSNLTSDKQGWGLIQWTPGAKIIGIAKSQGVDGPIYELETQLTIIWNHMNGTSPNGTQNMLEGFKKITTKGEAGAVEATTYFESTMESAGVVAPADRQAAAKAALTKYGSGASADLNGSSDEGSGGCACQSNQGLSTANGLDDTLKDDANKNGSQTAISVSTVDGKTTADAGGDTQLPTRSSYKLYTAYATLRAIEDGKISWSTKVWNGKSVETTMEAMIVNSNNSAASALRTNSTIGTPAEVTKMLQQDLGLSNKTVMGSGSEDNSNSRSTANDFTKFLILLQNQKLFGITRDAYYDKLLSFMKRATTDGVSARDGIVAGVPKSVEVADKPGWAGAGEDPASNDVGIVYLSGNPYVISILTNKPNQWDGVAKISKAVYTAINGSDSASPSSESGDLTIDNGCGSNSQGNGDLVGTIKDYAWPDYHSPPYLQRKPAYADAVTAAQKNGTYTGGTVNGVPGIDCGGFVTIAMIDSGYEPNYNSSGKGGATGNPSNPGTQWGWLEKNWQKIDPASTHDLKPGDVAINSSHTYIYVGGEVKKDGFNSDTASASYSTNGNGRAPMAGHELAADPAFTWYRKK